MTLRSIGNHVIGAAIVVATMGSYTDAQVAAQQANSATYVSAEMTKGKLNPAESKPGDEVVLKLKDDLKSNGHVVLKKGATIMGVVKKVKRIEGKNNAGANSQAMMEIEWFSPEAQGKAPREVLIALRSVTQVSRLRAQDEDHAFADEFGTVAVPARSTGRNTGGLLAGAIGSTAGTVGVVAPVSTRTSGQTNMALLSMPSVVAVDHQTSSAIESSFGTPASGRLFKTGSGELVSPSGSRQSVELFSRLTNDTVITSHSRNFEISSGAQMQLLVGVNKKH
jgi:hypothetical protein